MDIKGGINGIQFVNKLPYFVGEATEGGGHLTIQLTSDGSKANEVQCQGSRSYQENSSSWADIVKKNEQYHERMGLSFVPTESNQVVPTDDDVAEGVEKWKHSLVGFLLGRSPPF